MQGAQLAELELLYKEEQLLRKRYFNTIEGPIFLNISSAKVILCGFFFFFSPSEVAEISFSCMHLRYERKDQSVLSFKTS